MKFFGLILLAIVCACIGVSLEYAGQVLYLAAKRLMDAAHDLEDYAIELGLMD